MNIKEAQQQIQEFADKLKAELDAPGRLKVGDYYWTIDIGLGGIHQPKWRDSKIDRFRESIGWVWETRDEAQRHFNKLQAEERVRNYIAKANKEADWVADFSNDRQQKATWQYNHIAGEVYRELNQFVQKAEAWRYIKPALGGQLIEDCGDDIKRILGVE